MRNNPYSSFTSILSHQLWCRSKSVKKTKHGGRGLTKILKMGNKMKNWNEKKKKKKKMWKEH